MTLFFGLTSFSQSYLVEWGKIQNGEVVNGNLQSIKNGKTTATAKAVLKGSKDTTNADANGFIEYVIEDFNVIREIGFSTIGLNGQAKKELKYSVHLIKGGKARFVHARKMLGIYNVQVGDTIKISREFGVLKYNINNQLLNSKETNPEEDLSISVKMFGKDAFISDLMSDIRVEPLSVLLSVDNSTNTFDYSISGGTESNYKILIENTKEEINGSNGSYTVPKKGTYRLQISDSENTIKREVTIGEDLNWTDFVFTTVSGGELVVTEDSLKGYASANSQQTITPSGNWVAEYILDFDNDRKSWGVKGSLDGRIAGYISNFYLSDLSSKEVSYFFKGNLVKSFKASTGDIVRMETKNGVISSFFNGDLIRSDKYTFAADYKLTAMLRPQASFDQITFFPNYQRPVEVTFDEQTLLGSIEVNVPATIEGPFHYLIGTEGFVDLSNLYTTIKDSIGFPVDSTLLTAKTEANNFVFDDLKPGVYYISVLNGDNKTITREVTTINQRLILANNSTLHKEGELLIADEDNTLEDFPLFVTKNAENNEYGVELFDVVSEQFFGFGYDSIQLSTKEDIQYGFYVVKGQAFPIIDGVFNERGIWIKEKSQLSLKFNSNEVNYFVNRKNVENALINYEAKNDPVYNLKHGVSKAQVIFKPIIIKLPIFPSYNVNVNVTPIPCDLNVSEADINFQVSGGFFYTVSSSNLIITDESGNTVSTINPNTQQSLQNLGPGYYHITGNIQFNSQLTFFPSYSISVSEYFVIGYPVNWINKVQTLYTAQNESLKRDGTSGSGYGFLNFGYASSSNKINSAGENWVDFKIRDFKRFVQFYKWSVAPLSQLNSSNDAFLLYNNSANQMLILHNLFLSFEPYSEEDRFRISYDGNQISFYRNYGNPVFQMNASAANLQKINAFLSNLIAVSGERKSEIYDVFTNMSCHKPILYAKLESNLRGVKYKPIEDKVYFFNTEEYYDVDQLLDYKVYKTDRSVVLDTQNQNLINFYGDNRLSLDVASLTPGAYVLEVYNDKEEVFYLRFTKQ